MLLAPLAPNGAFKIYLYARDVDMRKSFDGLMAIVQNEFQRDLRHGDLFLFLNRRRDRIKALRWETDGLTIWMKRLECGTYERPVRPSADGAHLEIDATDLALLLAGVEFQSARRRRRYVWRGATSESTNSSANHSATPTSAVAAPTIAAPAAAHPTTRK